MIMGELTLILLSTFNNSFKGLHEKFLKVKIAIYMTVSVIVFTSIHREGSVCLFYSNIYTTFKRKKLKITR